MTRSASVTHILVFIYASVLAATILACLAVEIDENVSASVEHPELRKLVALPIQAHLCDIAGTGQVVESHPQWFRIVVDQYWFGDPGSNTLSIAVSSDPPPVASEPVLFLASTNAFLREEFAEPVGVLSRWSFLTNRVVNLPEDSQMPQAVPLALLADSRSWLPLTVDSGAVSSYASNLVYTAKVSRDSQAFYELVRDGANVSANVSYRVQQESMTVLRLWAFYESEDFVDTMWNDPLIPGPVRAAIKFRFPDWE